ncbi:hypothetical protein M431DRAFT_103190 [Trichoderma harzianum CBS 226.95]|uniref:Uncharacterized protein n=1 Tax=Trichoderma harzianum CBS 226.95 TaxID=983964 RepID=A0A2T4ASK7_TRIHA|nr:hypothetical protein M431DRAFT_103190 [Trichoderma harzianum CBS 226.95]PTB60040.1 hypothetical protein M431DRAFT_103190 [Trichoderma harzianum CBS 226.95]
MATQPPLNCKTTLNGAETWIPCPTTTTSKQTTTTTTASTTTTTTTSPSSTTTTTTRSTDTTSSSPTPTKPDGTTGLPSDTSTSVKKTSTAVSNPDSSVTSSLPASSQTALPLHQHASLSTGATAGIAVGCAAAGLIIGLLAALLLFRRRKGKGVTDISHAPILVESKEPPSTENIDGIGSVAGIRLGQFLLDGAPGQEIVSELQALSELIRQHVEDYYTLQPVDVSVGSLSQSLQNLGLGSSGLGLTAEAIATLCTNSYSRQIGLRHVISNVIFASIDFHTRSNLSMLPGPAAGLLQSIPGAEYGGNNNLAFSQALQTWRRLSAFLLHQNRSQRTSLQADAFTIAPQAQLVTNSLNNFLNAFVIPGQNSQQASHLQEVVIECAKLGYVLFSHPVDWKFIFEESGTIVADANVVVICPGLEKCSDRDGNPLRPPRRVAAPVEATL